MKNKSPAFQFYPDDWLGSKAIALMKPSHEGGYIRLLCYQWNDPTCTLPNNFEQLRVLSRLGAEFRSAWKYLKQVFVPFPKDKTRVYNVRLYEEMLKQQQHREEMAAAGKRGAMARWGHEVEPKSDMARPYSEDGLAIALPLDDNGKAMLRPMAKHGSSSPSSSPSSFPDKTTKEELSPPPKTAKNTTQAQKLSVFYKQYVMLSSSPAYTEKVFHDALARGLDYSGMMSAIEQQKWKGQDVRPWIREFEKEHHQKEARPKIFRASDEPERKPYPPAIKKMLAEAVDKLTLHPKGKTDADKPGSADAKS